MIDRDQVTTLLRHRAPALGLEHELPPSAPNLRSFATLARPRWIWPQLLDAAAQAAGLCVRAGAALPADAQLLVVAYRDVTPLRDPEGPSFVIQVRPLRSFLQMHQFAIAVADLAGHVVLSAEVTLAQAPGAAS